ncbi:MAG: hypothetical protein EXR29_00705 [Betaproteobacteria bacterium]|nr:hypothetical protein [Betaproteobacteria bacterium]
MSEAESLHGERTAAFLYRRIAARERDPRKQRLFQELARDAEAQGAHWERILRESGAPPAVYRPDPRARIVGLLVDLLGPERLTHALIAMKVRGMSVYRGGDMALASKHDEIGEQHKSGNPSGSLRAAVFGVNDGLVSNASLILGVAGAGSGNAMIVLTGIAGMLAGAFSMAAGEYVSVRSQREMYEYQIALEKAELEEYPEEEAAELALIFQARGMSMEDATRNAQALLTDPQRALETLTREELGLNPQDLGSPWVAAIWSLLAFGAGSVIPLLPFFWLKGTVALYACIGVSAVALYLVGAATSLFSGKHAAAGGLRMLAIGAAAGTLTFAIGRALGINLV